MYQINPVLGAIWKNLSLLKVEVFVWMALQKQSSSEIDLLSRNRNQEGQGTMCPRCSTCPETLHHLFIHCPVLLGSLVRNYGMVEYPLGVPRITDEAVHLVI